LYLQRYFKYETHLLQRLTQLLQVDEASLHQRKQQLLAMTDLVTKLFVGDHSIQPNWQLVAAMTAFLHNFTIITGGPGTGKTTTVAKILALLFTVYPSLNVVLAAPTGKASARMAESLRNARLPIDEFILQKFAALTPSTIHRLLGWQKGSPYFRHNAANPIHADLIIVDEASMIDVALFAKLFDAIGTNTRIILLGDKDQLAAVEAGTLFGDLCRAQSSPNVFSEDLRQFMQHFSVNLATNEVSVHKIPAHPLMDHVVLLQQSHRFKADEGIGKFSKAVIANDVATLNSFFHENQDQALMLDPLYDKQVFEDLINTYKHYILEPDIERALHRFNEFRILCAVKSGSTGVHAINAAVELYLARKGYISKDSFYYNNRPIMVTQNDYATGLFNGDIGILRPDGDGVMKAWFLQSDEEKGTVLKSVLPGFIPQMETVYAMTIHKSQGSEFDTVLVILPENPHRLITRELLYTGLTRAKKRAIVQSSQEVILAAAASMVQRGSGINERLASV
jgi:exodeoxyribonuclease V alpha subunit